MISVCMATYKGEKYLKDQLDSILKHHTKTQAQKKWIKTHLSTLYKAYLLNYVILSKLNGFTGFTILSVVHTHYLILGISMALVLFSIRNCIKDSF